MEFTTDAMAPTPEEMQWANAIKKAALEAGLKRLSDFEYMQHAIVAKDKVDKALKRIRGMEKFREQYKVEGEGSVEEALRLFKEFNTRLPNFMLGLGMDHKGQGIQFAEYKTFHPKMLKTEDDWRLIMVLFFYLFNATQADLSAVRNGMRFAADCKGMGWKNFSLEIEKRFADFYQDAYPIRMKESAMLDAPVIINTIINLVKVFLSDKIKETIVLKSRESYLEEANFPSDLIPEAWGGTCTVETMEKTVEMLLTRRQASVAAFHLTAV